MDISTAEQQPLPFFTEVEQLATKHKLGTLQQSYMKTDTSRRLFVNAIVWISASIVGMIFVLALVLRLVLPGPLAGLNNYLTAALLAVIGFVILYGCFRQGLLNLRAYQYRNREQVHLYTEGMVSLEDQTAHLVVRWDEIVELTRGDIEDEASGKVTLDRIYLALKHDAEQQIFFQPALPQLLEICTQVEQMYTEASLPALLARYSNGEHLQFDELNVSQNGVSIPRALGATEYDTFTWDQLATQGGKLEISQPYTTITVQGKDATEETLYKEFTCEIVNACLLKALLAERK
ncbi:MAG: hypothetical protein H0U76_15525 [Ktedonobacteraceae bacterium]|nr:hypothetical protein [Ktedonobacteraceae bacterium]